MGEDRIPRSIPGKHHLKNTLTRAHLNYDGAVSELRAWFGPRGWPSLVSKNESKDHCVEDSVEAETGKSRSERRGRSKSRGEEPGRQAYQRRPFHRHDGDACHLGVQD